MCVCRDSPKIFYLDFLRCGLCPQRIKSELIPRDLPWWHTAETLSGQKSWRWSAIQLSCSIRSVFQLWVCRVSPKIFYLDFLRCGLSPQRINSELIPQDVRWWPTAEKFWVQKSVVTLCECFSIMIGCCLGMSDREVLRAEELTLISDPIVLFNLCLPAHRFLPHTL